MLNDHIIVLNPAHTSQRGSLPNSHHFSHEASPYSTSHSPNHHNNLFFNYVDHYIEDDVDGDDQYDYLEAIMAEKERRQLHNRAIRQKAYIEALERKREQQWIEKERRRQQYLMEVECRRHREEEEKRVREELEKQFMVQLEHLERQRQEELEAEQMKSHRARALEELRRLEMIEKRVADSSFELPFRRSEKDEDLVLGLDGSLYRIVNRNESINDMQYSNPIRQQYVVEQSRRNHQNKSENDGFDLFNKRNLDINRAEQVGNEITNNPKAKRTISERRKVKISSKSPVLIGEVEDASDSECEDEYNDWWHNRRPQPGQWIEPVEIMKSNV